MSSIDTVVKQHDQTVTAGPHELHWCGRAPKKVRSFFQIAYRVQAVGCKSYTVMVRPLTCGLGQSATLVQPKPQLQRVDRPPGTSSVINEEKKPRCKRQTDTEYSSSSLLRVSFSGEKKQADTISVWLTAGTQTGLKPVRTHCSSIAHFLPSSDGKRVAKISHYHRPLGDQ
jgi:hypothetical protein